VSTASSAQLSEVEGELLFGRDEVGVGARNVAGSCQDDPHHQSYLSRILGAKRPSCLPR